MYSPSLLAEIKSKLPLSEIIGKTVQLRKKGHEYHGLCPFHQEKTPSFTVNNAKEFYHCFGCGQHGSVFDFLIHQNHLTFIEAVRQAADIAGVALPALAASPMPEETQTKKVLSQILESACQFLETNLQKPEGKEALDYLILQRKLTLPTIKKFHLGVAFAGKDLLKEHLLEKGYSFDLIKTAGLLSERPDGTWHDKFRNRIMFPILDRKGNIIAFGGRLLGPGEPKYLNSPETPLFQKGHTLYNWFNAQQSSQKKDSLVVVEGYMDVISLTQHGYERVVAPLGTALTEEQIQWLWKLCNEPILCFDGDDAGQRAAKRAAERSLPFLKPGQSLSFLNLPPSEDPDTFIQTNGLPAWRSLFSQTSPLVNVLWESETSHYARKTPEEKALLKKILETFSRQIQDATVRNYYLQEFRSRLFLWANTSKKVSLSLKSHSQKKINAIDLQERILLATILLHPSLSDQVSEEFALIDFEVPAYTDLQKEMILYFSREGLLEKEPLTPYLIKSGYQKTVQSLLETDFLIHAPFLKSSNLDDILEGWNQVRQAHGQKLLEQEELDMAKKQLSANLSAHEWQRYKQLKESIVSRNDEE